MLKYLSTQVGDKALSHAHSQSDENPDGYTGSVKAQIEKFILFCLLITRSHQATHLVFISSNTDKVTGLPLLFSGKVHHSQFL